MMRNILKFIAALCIVLSGLEGFSQNLSNRGKEFYVAYGHHQFMELTVGGSLYNSQEMVLYFSAEEEARVTVSINGTVWTRTWIVPANSVISTATEVPIAGVPTATPGFMPKAGTYDCRIWDIAPPAGNGGEGVYQRGIYISSDVPIVAYAHTFGSASSGATMLMPIETWGYSYISINSKQNYQPNCFSWAYAVAQHDNTVIEIIPSVLTRNGRPAGVPFNITLNKGEVYQIIGANPSGGNASLEISGTKFKSIANASGDCYPIAVFSGSSRTSNPISCGSGGGDNDNQQLFPIQAWGKRYLTAPTSRSTAPNQFMRNSYKILVSDPSAQVRVNGALLTGLTNSHYFYESTTADLITSDKPIMVAQFMTGGGCMGGGVGDPEMIYISPIEQGIKRTGFFRNNAEAMQVNYLTLIVPNGGTGLSSLRIDGLPINILPPGVVHTYPHPQNSNYTVVVRKWEGFAMYPAPPPGQCTVQSDSAFTAITYGLGSVESYGYNAGTNINNLNAISSIQNQPDPLTPEHPYTCVGTPIKLSALVAYQPTQLDWQISTLGADITPNADVNMTAPVSAGTVVVNGITYHKYTLPGTYVFNRADTFYIPLQATHASIENCYNREELFIRIIVKERPVANFTFTHTGCTLDTINFTGNGTTSNGYTINAWNWQFPGPTTATGQLVKKVLPPGANPVTLSVVSSGGCSSDTTRTINVNPKPTATISATPTSVCEDGSITFTPTAVYADPAALTSWYWDFGNGNTLNETSSTSPSATYPDYGSYTVKHVVKASNLCISDTATTIVTIYAKPVVTFDYPVGCLPPGGVVQFTSTATVPDGQALTTYTWDFGDPNANGGNPNTSVLQNPTHTYIDYGTYNITHTVTTANGCTEDTVIAATFNIRPTLQYTALNAVCENVTGTVSVANGSVTNGVPGNGVYHGPATDLAGNFNPSVAGPGNHTIWYVFTSTAGCADSLSQTIQVHAKPQPNFTFPNAGCLATNGLVQFNNTSTIADAQTMTWLWNFDDPNASGGNPNTSTAQNPSHNFGEGSFDINLEATSSNGCVSNITITAAFAVTPDLNYPALAPVCENISPYSIATATVLNNVTGSGVYSGPGTNAAGQFNPATAGPGTHTITYTYTTTGGCTASRTSTITVHPRPISSFTFDNSICLGETVTITSTSTIPSGTIATWNWNLGNGDTPSYPNGNPFTVNYTSANNYNVQLVTVSNQGCISLPFTQSIAVNPLPVTAFTLPTGICMPGGVANFTNGSTIPGGSALTYQWNFGDGVGTSTNTNPSYTYGAIGSYDVTLVATSAAGCSGQLTQVLDDFYDKPIADFTVTPQELCQGMDNVFTDGSSAPNSTIQTWQWNFDDGTSSANTNPTKRFNTPGVYDVTLIVTNAVGCISEPFILPVTVHLQPVIDAGRSFVLPQGTTVQLDATANSAGLNFTWSPPVGLSNANILNPMLTANQDQVYVLTAVGDFNCMAEDSIIVKILKPLNIPNIFTPNGDNIHDKWMIPNLADYPGCTVEIFNRYGQQVYYSEGYNNPWDGTMKGKPLPVGTYYYVIVLQNGFKPVTGSITIVR